MNLEFLYVPTRDLVASLALYREAFGCEEAWREGDATAALTVPGSSVQLMLDASDPDAAPGPMFVVDSVRAFDAAKPVALQPLGAVTEIPGGFLAVYQEPGGMTIYVLDQSTDASTG